jgi:hypothetical protein
MVKMAFTDFIRLCRQGALCFFRHFGMGSRGMSTRPINRTLLWVGWYGFLACVVGCSETLETGYQPRALNASDVTRRGYYASPYTREAKAAELERDRGNEAPRPRPSY